ncbi:MAG: hypothetical protein P8M80_16115 [Pirellulaceae bacterium]|jgi:hypothetical protein|nr:hypothetical protein [Pirellulaceae bacterium]MDG2470807.1 hypothetical protein [Pirellulaceae bacterium]
MPERSKFQKNVIRNYYENRENIAIQRLQELISELYLSEGKRRKQQWKHVETHLGKMGVKQKTIDHLLEQDNPELVANLLKKLDR